MPGRSYTAGSSYRYGFNGKENDNEVKGDGGEVAFENRIYDPRTAKWFSLDPLQKKYPGETHYGFVSDNPILYADEDGRDKIITLTVIGKDGKSQSITRIDKDFFVYKHIEIPGFGNDKYYKQDLIVNTTIDLRGKTGKATYSEELGNRTEISWMTFTMQPVYGFFGKKFSGPRGSQAGGITFTSEFASQVDGPQTDAREGSDGTVNIDALTAAFGALSKSGEALKFTIEDLPDWISEAKDIVELSEDSKETSSANNSSITKRKPVIKSTPPRDGPGWQFYVRNKDGRLKEAGRQEGMEDSTVKGQNGAPDTTYKRPFKSPPPPKKDIKRH